MKNSSDTFGNLNSALVACSAEPQPTAPPRPQLIKSDIILFDTWSLMMIPYGMKHVATLSVMILSI